MIKRSSIALAKILGGVAALMIVMLGLFCWRLSMGPIDLPGLKGRIEGQLTAARSGRPVRISGTELAWGEGPRPSLQLRARGVTALDSEGHELSRARYMAIGLRFSALPFAPSGYRPPRGPR